MKTYPDREPSAILGFASMLLAYIFVILGIKQEREINNGVITFKRAFLTGLAISFIISTIYVLVWLVIYYNFFPDFMDKYSEMALKNTNLEALAAKITEMNQMKEWYKNPLMENKITISEPFAKTMMFCEGEGESSFLDMLKKVNSYSVNIDNTLTFSMGDIAVMRFVKK